MPLEPLLKEIHYEGANHLSNKYTYISCRLMLCVPAPVRLKFIPKVSAEMKIREARTGQ
jgi:hypothetical protein